MKKVKAVFFELSNWCNHRCIFCPRKNSKTPEYLDIKNFIKILEHLEDNEVENFVFGLYDEPIANPNIFDMIAILRGLYPKTKVTISTNGTLLSDFIIRILYEQNVRINMSVYGPNKRLHEKLCGARTWEKTNEVISIANNLRKQTNLPVEYLEIYVVRNKYNINHLEQIEEHVSNITNGDIGVNFVTLSNRGGYLKDFDEINCRKVKKADDGKVCNFPAECIAIRYNGDWALCPNDFFGEYSLGNLIEDTVSQNFKNNIDRFAGLSADSPDICKQCIRYDWQAEYE